MDSKIPTPQSSLSAFRLVLYAFFYDFVNVGVYSWDNLSTTGRCHVDHDTACSIRQVTDSCIVRVLLPHLFTPIGPIIYKTTGNVNLPTSLDTFYHQLVRLCEPQYVFWFISLSLYLTLRLSWLAGQQNPTGTPRRQVGSRREAKKQISRNTCRLGRTSALQGRDRC